MIEKYFVKGAVFTWKYSSPPPDPIEDGLIIESGQDPGPPMTYTGLDDVMGYGPVPKIFSSIYAFIRPPSSYGLYTAPATNIRYMWLDYLPGRTTYVRPGNSDVLTGPMSGCWVCTWTRWGNRYVGHIGTVNADRNSGVKSNFVDYIQGLQDAYLTVFDPMGAWSENELNAIIDEVDPKVDGHLCLEITTLVTAENDCYSILLFNKQPTNSWVCGGWKKVRPLDQAAVLRTLRE